MGRTLKIMCGVVLAAILLTGCRYSATYTINADNTVSGRIYTAGYLDPGDASAHDTIKAYIDGDADNIASAFSTSVKSLYIDGDWYGYFIDITDEPLPSFAAAPEAAWDIQIIRTGPQYRVNGYTFTDDDDVPRPSARDNGGYLTVDVRMPGNLTYSVSASLATETPARVQWDLLNVVPVGTTPTATSDASSPEPPAPPAPEPVVTVVIPPAPEPVVTPSVTPSASPSAPPLIAPAPSGDDNGIPLWVWAVGGVLVLALAGMIGFMVANRKTPTPAPAASATKAKPKPKAPVEEAPEPEDDEDGEDSEEESPPRKK